MEKNKFDVFLSICFKAGKILSIIMIALTIISFVGSGIWLFNIKDAKLDIPKFEKLEKSLLKEMPKYSKKDNEEITKNEKNSEKIKYKKYDKQIEKIVKRNKLNYRATQYIQGSIKQLPDKDVKNYLKGLDKYCKEATAFIEKYEYSIIFFNQEIDKYGTWHRVDDPVMEDGRYNPYISLHIIWFYNEYYNENAQNQQLKIQEQNMVKITTGIVMLVSLLLFVLFLFLPILIKIEENTRKYE